MNQSPRHIAIVMDGNGRWAKARGLIRSQGHEQGVEALRRTVDAARDLNIPYLTVFSFSTENWSRPRAEIDALFNLLKLYVRKDLDKLVREGVRVRVIGDREALQPELLKIIRDAETRTAGNTERTLIIAFNYGGRSEIVRAARRLADGVEEGRLKAEDFDEALFADAMDAPDVPDPDLVIRTSGERRLSNFLLWQAAYSEFVFVDTLWPDFDIETLKGAIEEYRKRVRRFGDVEPHAV